MATKALIFPFSPCQFLLSGKHKKPYLYLRKRCKDRSSKAHQFYHVNSQIFVAAQLGRQLLGL